MNDKQGFQQQYDSFGNSIQPVPRNDTPESNPGLIYQPANQPVSPGPLQPGQTISSLTFQSGIAQRRIRITMNPVPAQANLDPGQSPGSIGIIDGSQNMIWVAGDTEQGGIQFITPDQPDQNALVILTSQAATANLVVIDIQNPASSATAMTIGVQGSGDGLAITMANASGSAIPLRLTNTTAVATHFTPVQTNQGVLGGTSTFWQSDGTTPNGALNGTQGDICFRGPGGQPFYCSITGSNVWVGM